MSCVIYLEFLSISVHYTLNMILEKVELAIMKVSIVVQTERIFDTVPRIHSHSIFIARQYKNIIKA
jgi:hypothetical protein